MHGTMRHLPNLITLMRLALVPVIGWLLHQGEHRLAFWLFVVSALSDFADGQIARHWHAESRFGAVVDPIADKLTMFVVTVLLALQGALPWWFAAVLVARDLVIVTGALAFRWVAGALEMAPTRISKLNTALQFVLLLAVLAVQGDLVPDGPWIGLLIAVTLATMAASGLHYVLAWGRRAARLHRRGEA
ncbi:MAG: CDP-alcohol phosphatidyltransferase family protein [Ideonella sp.]|nr:CDP-alcohol phosphatidyltransferase family protein [Ideonella sp.]